MATLSASDDANAIDNQAILLALVEQIKANSKAFSNFRLKFPAARTSTNPMFQGDNATSFLKKFEDLLDEYEPDADDKRKVKLLERNIEYNLRS